jgi:hypothetical protein
MTGLSDAHHFRKMVAGICMVVSPLLLLAGTIIQPSTGTSESSVVAAAASHADAYYATSLLYLLSIVLAVPAVLGLMHMLRERGVAFGHVGGGLGILGLLGFLGIVTIDGFVAWKMGAAPNRAANAALLKDIHESAGVYVPIYLMSFGFALGMVCLAMGLYRAKAVQSWMAVFIMVAAVLLVIAGPTASELVGIVGAAFLFVGLGSIGRMVLTETDADWEHTPEYSDFRPLAGMR